MLKPEFNKEVSYKSHTVSLMLELFESFSSLAFNSLMIPCLGLISKVFWKSYKKS
jgi:hypothetical protein